VISPLRRNRRRRLPRARLFRRGIGIGRSKRRRRKSARTNQRKKRRANPSTSIELEVARKMSPRSRIKRPTNKLKG